MQIRERVHFDDKGMIVQKTHDATPTLDALGRIKAAGLGQSGESRHVGRVPGAMIAMWLKEAGVRWEDRQARDEVIRRKMMSGEFAAFRNWQGSY